MATSLSGSGDLESTTAGQLLTTTRFMYMSADLQKVK